MAKGRKKKPRKIKFYQKNLKIPESQNRKLREFCKVHHTTENKVFRQALREFLKRNVHLTDHVHHEISPNQLTLFDFFGEDSTGTAS